MSSGEILKKLDKGPPWYRSSRYLLAFLAAVGYSHFFIQRVNLSMAIVCMVNHTAVDIMKNEAEAAHRKSILHHSTTYAPYPSHLIQTMRAGQYRDAYWHSRNDTAKIKTTSSPREITETDISHSGQDIDANEHDSVKNVQETSCAAINMNGTEREDGELAWSKETQGMILGGLYWGYAIIQLPSQRIIQKVGSKWLSLVSVLLMSTMTMLGPIAARMDPWALMFIRIVQGFASALGVPAIYAMWGQWAPPQERTKLMSICFSGSMIANAIVYPTSGLLCRYGFAGGWPSVFYVFGIVGFAWCVLWLIFAHETPESHPWINPDERAFIVASLRDGNTKHKGSVPWLKLLKSGPVWAVVLAQLGYDYAFFMLLAVLPQYMREVLKFDIKSNGLYTMMPHIAHYVFTNLWGLISASLMTKGYLSVCKVRKLSTIIGDVIPAVLFIIISFLDCSHAMIVVVLMTCAIGISGTNMQGFMVNPYDIAPKYATAILCLSNTVAVASGIVSPFLVGAITRDKTREQWQMVFFVTAGITLGCLLFYLIFGSGQEMEWAKSEMEFEVDVEGPEKLNTAEGRSIKIDPETTKLDGAGEESECYSQLIGGYCKDVTTKLIKENGYSDIDIRVKVTSVGDCDVNMKLIRSNTKLTDPTDDLPESVV